MKYSERAKQVIQYASQEAARLGHNSVGTGHLLLGIIRHGENVAVDILKDARIDLDKLKLEIEKMVEERPHGVTIDKVELSTRSKMALKLSESESERMGRKYVGTEHILLGIMLERDGIGAKVLEKFGLSVEQLRDYISQIEYTDERTVSSPTYSRSDLLINPIEHQVEYESVGPQDRILDLFEASRLLRVKPDEFEKMLETTDVPARKIAGQWRFSQNALLKWLGEGKSSDYFEKDKNSYKKEVS